MVHESVTATTASGALAADLAGDSADLLDLSAALGVEFRRVVTELLREPARPAPAVVRTLAALGASPRPGGPHGDAPPFVWVRLVPTGLRARSADRKRLTVRAGWLEPAAVRCIAAEARAAGPETEVQIIVPFDSGEAAAARVRVLCSAVAPEVKLTIDVQGEEPSSRRPPARRTGWWGPSGRASRGARPAGGASGFRTGTWVVLGPVGATS